MPFKVRIEYDNSPESPRECDNLGTMACWHRRYNLGDEQPRNDPMEHRVSLIQQHETKDLDRYNLTDTQIRNLWDKHFISLPLYLYDHSGITMSTNTFSCPWDSGQVGFIYVSKDAVRKEFGWNKLSNRRLKRVKNYLKGEVETYDQFLTGEIYGFVIDEVDEEGDVIEENVDSCWGFYGREDAQSEGEALAKNLTEEAEIQAERKIFPVASMGI